jgi:glycosyltransferase involved in cell wall biosynthesis
MRIAVYTAIFGEYNPLRAVPKQTVEADYYCYTDNYNLVCEGWKTVFADYPRKDLHPRIRAKYFKVLFHYLQELKGYDVLIYIDGSIEIKSADFVKWCLDNLKGDYLLFKHPERDCIFEEFEASDECRKYDHEDKIAQRRDYRMRYPEHGGLYACGVMVRRPTDQVKQTMQDWWHEILKYTYQDQVSFPIVCQDNGLKPDTFAENQYKNKYFSVLWHDDVVPEKKVSVLMPVYNTNLEHCKQAIASVLKQSYRSFELLIVDDGSTDIPLIEYINSLQPAVKAPGIQVRVMRLQNNSGLSVALNSAIDHCLGELIARMDSDDIAKPDWLEKMVTFMDRNPGAKICGCQLKSFGVYNHTTKHPAIVDKKYVLQPGMNWIVNHPGIIFRKDFIQSLDGYPIVDPKLQIEDWALWCKILASGHYLYNIPDMLIDYRVERMREDTTARKQFREECRATLVNKYKDNVTYHMASMPERINALKDSVASILPQCDELIVYLNGFDKVPAYLNNPKIKIHYSEKEYGDIGDAGKFFGCDEWTGYNFTVDDKIIYPADYTERTIEKIEQFGRKAIVTYHGRKLPTDRKCQSYYKDYIWVADYLKNNRMETRIHIPGTGCMAFHSEGAKLDFNSFTHTNMADIFVGLIANKKDIPVMVLKHAEGFMKISPNYDKANSIMNSFAHNDTVQTELINKQKWKNYDKK